MSCECESTSERESIRSLIARRALDHGDSLFLLDARSERRLTYAQLAQRVTGFRSVLQSRNVASGARVGLLIANPIDFAIALFAVLADGSLAAPLDPTAAVINTEQINRRISNLHLDAVLADRLAPPLVSVPWLETTDFVAVGANDVDAPQRTGGIILSSSGTTGTPKVIALTEGQLMHTAAHVATNNRLSSDERGFNPLPLWHINAEVVGLLATLFSGASLVLDDRFHRSDFWSVVDRFKVTWINAVPAIISRIATLRHGESVTETLRFVRSASAPLSPVLLASFETNTGVTVMESYGMTEAASQICVNPLDGPRKVGSVGPAVGVELRVRPLEDAMSRDATGSSVGHVEIRGPSVITEYDASGYEDRFDAEGWLTTGDLGYLDDDGYLFLVGRSDDVINRGGEKIFPREIEDVVLGLPDVQAAAVLGVADDVFGQVPVLYVQFTDSVANDHVDLGERVSELDGLLTATFARARRPVRVIVVEAFPAHATGKIQKKSLAADAGTVLLERELK